jgi:hypothetical protein
MNIDLPSTHLADCDKERGILAKLLQLANDGATASTAAEAALLAELQQKTEPVDSQLVRGSLAISAVEFTRPADTTAYATNDVVGDGTVIVFSNVARVPNGTGYVTNARLIKSTTTTANAVFRLWLYNIAPAATADNLPFKLLYVFRACRIGYIDLPCNVEGTGSDSASALVTNVNLKFNAALDSRNLFGVLEAKQAYAPGNAEKFWIELTVDQN